MKVVPCIQGLIKTALLSIIAVVILLPATASENGNSMNSLIFGPGESITYRLRYGFIETGRARLEIGNAVDEKTGEVIWPIEFHVGTTRLAGLLYDLDSTFVTFYKPILEQTLGFDRDSTERGVRRLTKVRLNPDANRAVVTRKSPEGEPETKTYNTGPAAHDIASAIFWLRKRDLKIGDVETVRIFTGRKAWDMVATVTEMDRVRLRSGRINAKKITLQTKFEGEAEARRDIEVWLSDDEHHIPVALRADLVLGSLRAEMLEYKPPSAASRKEN